MAILYIEDEEDYQILVRRILGKAGLEIQMASSGEEGFACLERETPDLLILDVNLPDGNGFEICQKLRKDPRWSKLPILMLTVRRRPEEWLMGFSAGANDYVAKPLNPPELIERVKGCLRDLRIAEDRPPEVGSPEYLLIQAAVSGNRAAFEVLIEQYKVRLIDSLRAAGKKQEDAEDIVSIAFVRAYEGLRQFRGQSSFYTWIYRIAFNEESHLRREKPKISLDALTHGEEQTISVVLTEPDRVGEETSRKDLKSQVHQAAAVIPETYRELLQLHFFQNIPCQAMARRLKIPYGTVLSRLHRAKHLLRQSYERGSR
jgi:RNA polymerase sigma factor (sigma-70 family)